MLRGRGIEAAFNARVEPILMKALGSPILGTSLNAAYSRAPDQVQAWFWRAMSRSRYPNPCSRPLGLGAWTVRFAGKKVALPLEGRSPGIEWDNATAILGHDIEVKRTYRAFIERGLSDVFIDVGTNFGTHSLLFLAHGIRTISFEPLPECHDYFLNTCLLNRVRPDLRRVALGAEPDRLRMRYPPGQTWLAKVVDGSPEPADDAEVEVEAEVTTLDAALAGDQLEPGRILLKLDVEGHELAVLQGARRTLGTLRPWVLFESDHRAPRRPLFDAFGEMGYRIEALPWIPGRSHSSLDMDAFSERRERNFMAVPCL